MIACANKTPGAKTRKFAQALTRTANQAAFSLVEVTLALGIVAIAIIPVFGLLPTGLNAFHQAIDASVTSQIAQRIINDAQQTDFYTLIDNRTSRFAPSATPRYFDDQGNELTTGTAAIYQVRTVITPTMSMPATTGSAANQNLATVTVQIANNPRGVPIAPDGSLMWPRSNIPIATYSAIIANNQSASELEDK